LKDFHELGPSYVRWIRVNYESYPNLASSGSRMLERRAAEIKSRMSHYRILLRASEMLAPTEKMTREIKDLRKDIEKDFGRTNLYEHLFATAIYTFGRGYQVKTRLFGDQIQPRTILRKFNQGE